MLVGEQLVRMIDLDLSNNVALKSLAGLSTRAYFWLA